MSQDNPLLRLTQLGQSIWYDYIIRDLLVSGQLARLIAEDGLRGMTSNPTIFEKAIAGSQLYDDDIRRLSEQGAHPQRPLWASTSTKDPHYPDIYYVEALIAPQTVNTLPPETLSAYRDHGVPSVRIQEGMAAGPGQLAKLADLGIDLRSITQELEEDGVAKFAASHASVLSGVEAKAESLAAR